MATTILPNYLPLPPCKSATEYAFVDKFSHPPSFGAHRDQKPILERITDLCVTVLRIGVFIIQPSLFVLGFICGAVWEETSYALEKVKTVFFQQSFVGRAIMSCGAIIAGPAVLLSTCFLTAARLGGQCHQALSVD